jgi:hypothetical protein
MEIKKGSKIWIVSYSRWKKEIKETTVKSVGKKYIRTELDDRIRFDINTLQEIDGYGYAAYLVTDLEEYQRKIFIQSVIRDCENFNWKTLEEEDLLRIKDIISNYL